MILVDIEVPALNKAYDFRLDERLCTAQILEEISVILFQEDRKDLLLCSCEQKRILPPDRTLWQAGIGNGARLLLI